MLIGNFSYQQSICLWVSLVIMREKLDAQSIMKHRAINILLLIIIIVVFLGIFPGNSQTAEAANSAIKIYIPLAIKPPEKLIGMYFQGLPLIEQDSYDGIINPTNNWSGNKLSIIGTFMNTYVDGNYYFHVAGTLDQVWDNGYVPFVNLEINATAYEIAAGRRDREINSWALAYKTYADGPNGEKRFAFLAPLQEMNSCQQGGCWTKWGGDPGNYIIAYRRIHQIFDQVGVPHSSVRWVFAPNGWSHYRYDYPFEDYYPGKEFVDVVAISAYNFGGCLPNAWQTPEQVFNNPKANYLSEGKFLDRMRILAPGKKIFISQTGTAGGSTAKNSWLNEAHDYLAGYPGVSGVLYFNLRSQCEWRVYSPPGVEYPGYVEGVLNSVYTRQTPQEIRDDLVFITR